MALPRGVARNLLPYNLELADQDVTPPGTHPVFFNFCEMLRVHFTVPSFLPNLTYREFVLGIPYVEPSRGFRPRGPLYFMPKLFLDDQLAVLGGLWFWGMKKSNANFTLTGDEFEVADQSGQRLMRLTYQPTMAFEPINRLADFAPWIAMLQQPLVSEMPLALGPFLTCSHFEKKWDDATARRLSSSLEIAQSFVPCLPQGTFSGDAVFGSFEVKARFRQGLPYPEIVRGAFGDHPSPMS